MSKRNALYPSDLSASPVLGVVGQANPVEIPNGIAPPRNEPSCDARCSDQLF